MRKRWLLALAGVSACAATDPLADSYEPPPDGPNVLTEAGAPDAAPPEAEAAAPCDDCEHFPTACTDDALCSNGLFDPSLPGGGGGFDLRATITTIRGRSTSDVWIAGTIGSLARFDGTSWKRSDAASRDSMLGLWLRDGSEVASGVPDTWAMKPWIYSRGGTPPEGATPPSPDGWTLSAPSWPPGYDIQIRIVSAWAALGSDWLWLTTSRRDVLDTTSSGLVRLRQGASTQFEIEAGPATPCAPGCNHMSAVHGASANDIWAVGARGTTMRITGADGDAPDATLYDSRTFETLNGVWAASASDVWSVGAHGNVRRWKGQGLDWDIVPNVPTSVDLNAISGTSSSDVWVVGDGGMVLHYDGTTWSRVKVAGVGARRPVFTAVWCPAPGRVLVGGQGVMLSLGGKP